MNDELLYEEEGLKHAAAECSRAYFVKQVPQRSGSFMSQWLHAGKLQQQELMGS